MQTLVIKRCLHVSSCRYRQRGIALKRYLRKKQAPFHNVRYIDSERVEKFGEIAEYPEAMPEYPPGKWGSMKKNLAWNWYYQSQNLRQYQTNFDRNNEMYLREKNMWYHSLDCPLNYPETKDFYQFISRTVISPDEPTLASDSLLSEEDISEISEQLKNIYRYNNRSETMTNGSLIPIVMDCLYNWLVPHHEHLKDVHIDEGADWESFIKRSGYDELSTLTKDPTILDEESLVKYRVNCRAVWQMRHRNPLPPVFPEDSIPTTEDNMPRYNYDPRMFNLKPVDCHGILTFPIHKTFHSDQFLINKPGFWGDTPFWRGDPCPFGLTGVVQMNAPDFMKELTCEADLAKQILDSHHLGEGLISAFTWTSAQAWNQGFNFYDDITYPFVSQLIITDGRVFRFLVYQLNSIAALSRGFDSGLPMNVVWASEPLSLFHSVDESGDIHDWDTGVLKKLIATFTSKPMAVEDRSLLLPYLVDRKKENLMNLVGEKDWERSKSVRIKTQPRSHPNEIYFQKMANRSELLDDIRKTFPNIGRLPEKYEQLAEEHRKQVFKNKGRQKTEAPPKKWR